MLLGFATLGGILALLWMFHPNGSSPRSPKGSVARKSSEEENRQLAAGLGAWCPGEDAATTAEHWGSAPRPSHDG